MKKEHESVILTPDELRKRYEGLEPSRMMTDAEIRRDDYMRRRIGSEAILVKSLRKFEAERREKRRRELEMKVSEAFHSAKAVIFDESKKLLSRPKKRWYPMEKKWR